MMYELEVKLYLTELMFTPSDDWKVIVDIDAMERAKGSQQKDGKKEGVVDEEKRLNELGVEKVGHPKCDKTDIMASLFSQTKSVEKTSRIAYHRSCNGHSYNNRKGQETPENNRGYSRCLIILLYLPKNLPA
jgi:hypothetical protein